MVDNKNHFKRRKVLQTAGLASFGVISTQTSSGNTSTDQTSIRLIEANITSDINISDDVIQPHIDVPHKYIVTSDGFLRFNHIISDKEKELLKNRPSIIFANGKLSRSANLLNPVKYDTFPVETTTGYRHSKAVKLEEPVIGENVVINSSKENPHIKIGDNKRDLDPNEEYEFELDEQEVLVKKATVLDEKIENEDIRKELRANKVKYEKVERTITPKVLVKDRGEVPIEEENT